MPTCSGVPALRSGSAVTNCSGRPAQACRCRAQRAGYGAQQQLKSGWRTSARKLTQAHVLPCFGWQGLNSHHMCGPAWCQLQSLRANCPQVWQGLKLQARQAGSWGQKNPNRQKIAKKATSQRKRRYSPMKQLFSLLGSAQPEKNCFFSGVSSTSGR